MEPGFKVWLKDRLTRELPGEEAQRRMMNNYRPQGPVPEHARQSAVLILMYPEGNETAVVLIERIANGSIHSGQIALPGGRVEPDDVNLIATALREANEEVALQPGTVDVLGELSQLYIPVSNFVVQPVVAFTSEKPALYASDGEVARILFLPLHDVFFRKEKVDVKASGAPNLTFHVNAYMLEENTILWGATAMIISELEVLWDEYLVSIKAKS